jgi:lysyl-tRNA synthetase class 2
MNTEEMLMKQKIDKLNSIKEMGINPYPYNFIQKNHASDIFEKFDELKKEEKTRSDVSIAGRIVSFRLMGKASFIHVQDSSGKIQSFVSKDEVGEDNYKLFRKLDLGDIIGVEGQVFRTKAGEISVWAKKVTLLCKSLRPLPEKWHGLKDTELRYRKRYLDLISNPQVKNIFIKRAKVMDFIRNYLNKKNYLEVETPIMQPIYGGAAARPFKSYLNDLKMDVYLRISNELYLKRLIVGGFERVYEFSKDFRNESIDSTHNPEFTQIEFYHAYADYNEMMKMVEEIIRGACKEANGITKVKFKNHEIDFAKPFNVMTMKDSIKKFAKIDVDKLNDMELKKRLDENKIHYDEFSKGIAIQLLFEEFVEDKLIQPTFIIEHPLETTPLCKVSRHCYELIERFELFISGFELSNAYSELNDPLKQRELLEEQSKKLKKGDEEANPMDEDFLEAIETGMPPTGGVGIGIDRLIMVLTGNDSIKEVILFPFMKI